VFSLFVCELAGVMVLTGYVEVPSVLATVLTIATVALVCGAVAEVTDE